MSSNKLFEAAAEILAGSKSKSSADPMQKPSSSVEDLGGPTPQNYKSNDDSAKLKQATKSSAAAPTTKPSDASAKMEDKDFEGEVIAEKMHDDEDEDKAMMMKKMKMKEKMKEDVTLSLLTILPSQKNSNLKSLQFLKLVLKTVLHKLKKKLKHITLACLKRQFKPSKMI